MTRDSHDCTVERQPDQPDMESVKSPGVKNIFLKKKIKFLTLLVLAFLLISPTHAQAPVWVPGTPSAGTPGPLTIPVNYGIDRVGTVYIVVYNFNNPSIYTPSDVRWLANLAPVPPRVAKAVIPINAGNINTVLQIIFDVFNAGTTHTIYIVAEGTPGGLQATVTKLYVTTLPCPKIDILTGFTQTQPCVNKGATARFNVAVDPDPLASGILKGTVWYLDWGDGSTTTYTSTADNDVPSLAIRTHTYTTVTDCNYIFSNTVQNPCGELRSVQYIAVVHGRDVPSDGDGMLDLVDNATGAQTVQVCAGTQTIVTIRDNSIWNCQNPVLPGGFTAIPNIEPRNIEWLYGRDPLGAITNTITGTVSIATLGNAPRTSGRISPVPYGPSSLSQAITIPATCQAGQYFRVYLKNWNKCNWLDPEYVDTYIDIVVIAAPPAPTVPDRTICEGDTRTLSVTSAPVGTITWYSNAGLTTVVGTGTTYTPPQTAPGIYNFWVTDQSLSGLQCMSPATMVTLTIREDLSRPAPITGPSNTCPNVSGLVFSVPNNPPVMPFGGPTEYYWTVTAGVSIASGQGTRQITVDVGTTSGNKTIRVYLRYVGSPQCTSNNRSTTLTVYSTAHNAGTISGSGICPGGTVNISSPAAATTGTPASSGPVYSWARAPGPGFTVWTNLPGTGATFSETMATTGTYRYRRTATFGCGTPVSTTVDIPVYSTVHNAGAIAGTDICAGGTVNITNTTSASTGSPASSGPAYSWDRAPGPGFSSWTSLSGTGATFSETMATPGVYRYRRTATFGCGTPVTTTVDITVFSTSHNAGTITGTDICPGGTVNITSTAPATTGTPASTGPTYSWQRAPGPGFTVWTNLSGSGASYSETMAAPGTYRYRRRATFGCGSTVSTTVDINVFSTTHNAGTISGTNACAGSPVVITSTAAATTGTPASSGPVYSWHRAPGPGFTVWTARPGTGADLTETVATPGTYRYRRTAAFGCGTPVTTTTDVTVYSTTHNAGTIGGSNVCAGEMVNISNTNSATTGSPASSGPVYSWERAPGPGFSTWTALTGTLPTFSEIMTTSGTYRYRRTATFGCGTPVSTTRDIVVRPLPTPVISGPDNVCQTATEVYSTPLIAGHTYSWSTTLGTIVGPSNGNTVTITWNSVGTGTVTVTETITATSCSFTTNPYSVVVNPGPPATAPVFVSGAANICRNGTLNIDVSDVATASQYIWDYSWVAGTNNATTAVSQISIDLTGIAPGTYTITVAGSNGCGTGPWMAPHTFNINDIPDLALLDRTVCSDEASAITLSISNPGPTISGLTYNITNINFGGLTPSAGLPATGNGLAAGVIADDAYINKTAANVNVIYAIVPVSLEGCSGPEENVTLTVRPEPVLAALSTSRCSDEALGFNLSVAAGSSPAATYNITAINPNGLTASAGSPATGNGLPANVISDDAWRNTTAAPVDVVYSIVPVGTNNCPGDTYTMTITVNPEPVLATLDATRCSDEPLGFSLAVAAGSVAAATYNITSINANGLTASAGSPAIGNGLAANVIADDAWTNTTANPVNVVYTVVPVSSESCQGDPKTITITVNPEPVLATLTNTVCSDSPSAITLAVTAGSVAAATYNITVIDDGGLTASAGSPATGNGLLAGVISDDAWTNKTNGNRNVVYTVVPVSAMGCAGNPADVVLTVMPEPVLADLDAAKCSDEALGFNLSLALGSSPAASYNITAINPNGLTASAGSPAVGNGLPANIIANDAWTNTTAAPVNVVYSVVPVGTNGCPGDTYTMTITVNPEPVLASLDATRCSDEPLGFNLNVAAGSVAAATYNITSINPNGLTASAGGPATGNGFPANVIANDAWTNTTLNPVDVIYTVVPVSAGNCQGDPRTITITVNPEPVLADLDDTKCSDEALGFNLSVAAGSVAAASYNITSINSNGLPASAGSPGTGNGLPANIISDDAWTNTNAVPVNVIYTVVPVSSLGCQGNPATVTITVNPEPVMATPGATKCSREALGFNLSVNAGGVAAATFDITSINANGLTESAGSPATGTGLPANIMADDAWINTTSASVNVVYTVVPVSAAGCYGNPADITITVKPEPVITAGQSTSSCSGNALNYAIGLDNFINPAAGVTFTWDAPVLNPVSPSFTGGTARLVASSANITDTFINTLGIIGTATYTVTPFKDGCAGLPVDIVINVGSEPVLDPDLNNTVCSNTAIGLILKEAPGSVVPTHYNISDINVETGLNPGPANAIIPEANAPATYLSGDIFINQTGVDKTVTYRVQPILAPDCFGDPVDVVITIRPQPVIVPGQTKTVCSGVAIGKEILLLPANTPAGTVFNWGIPVMSDASGQGTAGVNVAADPAGTVHINDIINNYSSAPITATYTVTPTSQFTCAGDPVPVVITINQEPVPQPISGRVDLCVGDNPVVYSVNPVGGSSFHWTVDPAVGTKTFDFNTNAIMITAAGTAGSGNISVYETNSLGCSGDPSTLAVQVWENPAPENITGDAIVCAFSTHTYGVTNRAGSVYSWTLPGGAAIIGDPSASSIQVIFGNVGGTILVRETNIAGCVTNHNPFSVTVNPLPTAFISNGGEICDGGTRPLNIAFTGVAPFNFTYAINGVPQAPIVTSSNPYTLNATLAGTYTIVNVSDNTGCTNTGTGSATITYLPKPTGTISGSGELCRGSSTTITITFTGVAPFTFTYTDGTTPVTVTAHPNNVYTTSVSPLVTSTYTLTSLTDFNNCVGVLSGSALINVNQPPVLTLTGTDLVCYNVHTGEVDLTISDGTPPFGISWTGPDGFTAPTEDISGLKAGYYAVAVTDSKGCTANGNITLTQPPQLAGAVGKTDITCFGADDGTITISGVSGGTGTYGYTINGGTSWEGSGDYSGLAPGTYNVQIRDAVNPTCVLTLNPALVINEPAVLSATITKTDITCFGANNGSIIISGASGGYGTYQYTINGGTTWLGSGSFTSLSPGFYNVLMRDAINTACVLVLDGALEITEPPVLAATLNSTNITCFGSSDGTITISAPSGGHDTYEYSINGGGSWQAAGSYTGLTPGTYNVQIRDALYPSCYIVLNNALLLTQPAILSASLASTNVTCNGAGDGTISITGASGGYGTYGYTINGGTDWFASGLFTNVNPGTYDVKIRDAVNTACVVTLNAGLQITEPASLSAMVIDSDITCFGANDALITITNSTGGYGTYQYSINGGTDWQDSPVFPSPPAGSYDVWIRDKAHPACMVNIDPAVLITEPAILDADVSSVNVSCFGAFDGRIEITNPTGGYGTYQYTITGGSSWQSSGTFANLAPGTYDVRIRDAAHIACEIILDPGLDITQPAALSADVASTNVTCFGEADGTITITNPAGGYGTYEYSINGGAAWQSSGSFTALSPGFYNVQIRDAAHTACIVILNGSLRITEPPMLTANVARTNITCNGADNGTITITSPMGGYGTYEYSINGGAGWQSSGSFTNLPPGTYIVMMRDATYPSCEMILNPGLVITEPDILDATVTPTMISCFGANNGIITISGASGGYGTYQYTANGGTTWQGFGTFTNLAPGFYDVRIRDAANQSCEIILDNALEITEPPVLAANITSTNVTCFGGNDGTITISGATGGYGTYEYSINGGGSWQASGSFSGLTPGSYNILIRDAAHTECIIVLNNAYIITQPGMLSATVSKTDISCNGNNDGTITISSPQGGYGTYEYSIDGGMSWQASGNYTGLAPDTYDIRLRDMAHPACMVILYPNLVITEPLPLTLSTTGDIVLNCYGDMTGMGTFYASGGTMPYSFIVTTNTTGGTLAAPGFNSQTFFNAGAGVITVMVADNNLCSANATITITQPDELTPGSILDNQVLCYGDNPATLYEDLAPTGGPGAYTFQWQSSTNAAGPFINIAGANLDEYSPPAGAMYTMYYRRMVTSGTCMPVYSNVVEIRVNPRPVALLTGGATICPGESSVIRITLMAGTGPFEIDIANYGTIPAYNSGDDIIVTPAVTTTYSLTRLRDANNCEVTAPSPNLNGTATIIVSDLPVITSFDPSPPVCEFTLASFRVTATGTNITYQWYVDINDGLGFNPVTDGGTYFGAQTPTLQIFNAVRSMDGYIYHVVVSGCGTDETSADAVFTVNTAPEIILHPKDSTVCLGQNAIMEADATGTNVTWQWYVNKGAGFVLSVDDANFSGSQTRTLTITDAQSSFNNWVFRAVASGICGVPVNTNFAVLRVINPPSVTLQPLPKAVCENASTSFLGNGTGYTSLLWQVSAGGGPWTDLADDATYIGTNTQQLAIMNAPVAFNNNRYRLAFISTCAVTYSDEALLTVYANPVVDFSGIDPVAACGGVPLVLDGNPQGGSGTYTQHRWTGDVGPLNNYFVQAPTFNSFISGTYNLNYRVTDSNGCTANDDLSVNVDSPSAQFTQDVDYGCTPLPVSFTKDMTDLDKWWWDFGDGSPLDSLNANPVHTFINTYPSAVEYYNVRLTVRSAGGCLAEYTTMITVYPEIDATFTPDVDVICSGNSITFTALAGATRYFWDYGDGVSGYGTNVSSHLYTNITTDPEVHTVTLTTTSFYNCVDIKTFDITVMPVPLPQFTADPLTQIFNPSGNPVTFTNSTSAGTWNWLWRFGDNTTSTEMNPVHSYTDVGTYTVTLIAGNANCSDSVSHSVSVVPPPPVASFDSIPSGCAPLYVSINNTSQNVEIPGTTYRWDFGDGSISTAKNPTYTYFTPGDYRIELVVTGPGGTSMATQVVSAWPSPKAYFEVTPATVYVNDERVRCFNLSEGATSYVWDFGDGDTSKVKEPYHRYLDEGEYDITLWAYSANGCTDMYVLAPAVTVLPVGEIRFASVFTPNKTGPIERSDLPTGGQEIDQFFFPPIRQTVINYKLQIFNRWGVLIFESHDINVPWNGYYKGELCKQGVYVWYVEGKFADGKPFKMVGDVTLLH